MAPFKYTSIYFVGFVTARLLIFKQNIYGETIIIALLMIFLYGVTAEFGIEVFFMEDVDEFSSNSALKCSNGVKGLPREFILMYKSSVSPISVSGRK